MAWKEDENDQRLSTPRSASFSTKIRSNVGRPLFREYRPAENLRRPWISRWIGQGHDPFGWISITMEDKEGDVAWNDAPLWQTLGYYNKTDIIHSVFWQFFSFIVCTLNWLKSNCVTCANERRIFHEEQKTFTRTIYWHFIHLSFAIFQSLSKFLYF